MLFSSHYYIPFLLTSLVLYWVVFRHWKTRLTFVTLGSLAFLAATHWASAALALVMTALVYAAGRWVSRTSRASVLLLTMAAPLSLLIVCKYLPQLPQFFPVPDFVVPLGLSYITFKHVHYLVERWRGSLTDHRFVDYLGYIFFFPMFPAGPIERFENFRLQAKGIKLDRSLFSRGVERILVGCLRKFVLADIVLGAALLSPKMVAENFHELGWHQLLFLGFIRFLYTYSDFAGYTDIAIGTGNLFGFRLMENFRFPILRANLSDFWRSWHISLSQWARDYIYFPLLGQTRNTVLALMATMLMIGLWHQLGPGWVFWGLHHGFGLVVLSRFHRLASRHPRLQRLRRHPAWTILGVGAVWAYVAAAYSLTVAPEAAKLSLMVYLRIVSLGAL